MKIAFLFKRSKDLIAPFSLTKREAYLQVIKEHNICIATTGLHNSISWKFGEYVAASRAILSEPLIYELPGNFENSKNYLSFNNEDELLNGTYSLLKNKDELFDMMNNNFHYYNNFLRHYRLVFNTLISIYQNEYAPDPWLMPLHTGAAQDRAQIHTGDGSDSHRRYP